MDIKRALISATIIWILGVTSYVSSFYVNIFGDQILQANLFLTISLIPSVIFGTHYYYKKAKLINGFKLASTMFMVAILLDALITVPIFMMPIGINYIDFFIDPGFWLIAAEYIITVLLYHIFMIYRRKIFST